MSVDRPPFVLRLCVVVGGFVLLVGCIGAAYLFLNDEHALSAAGPGLAPRVRVSAQGLPEGTDLLVNMCYREGDVDIRLPAKRMEADPDVWLLIEAPTDRTVTIEVIDQAAERPQVLAKRDVTLTPGETVRVNLLNTPER